MSEFGGGAAPAPGPATGPAVFNGAGGNVDGRDPAEPTGGQVQDSGVDPGDVGDDGIGNEQITLTQEELNKKIQRRLKRQETQLRKELEQQAQEEARRSRMDEVERLKVEREEAVAASKAAVAQAEQEIMLAKAEAIAASMGVGTDNLKYITRLVDLSEADRSDPETIQEAVSQVLKDVPALAAAAAPQDTSETSAGDQSLTMPTGRDRSPAASKPASGPGPSAKEQFDRLLRQRASTR